MRAISNPAFPLCGLLSLGGTANSDRLQEPEEAAPCGVERDRDVDPDKKSLAWFQRYREGSPVLDEEQVTLAS